MSGVCYSLFHFFPCSLMNCFILCFLNVMAAMLCRFCVIIPPANKLPAPLLLCLPVLSSLILSSLSSFCSWLKLPRLGNAIVPLPLVLRPKLVRFEKNSSEGTTRRYCSCLSAVSNSRPRSPASISEVIVDIPEPSLLSPLPSSDSHNVSDDLHRPMEVDIPQPSLLYLHPSPKEHDCRIRELNWE